MFRLAGEILLLGLRFPLLVAGVVCSSPTGRGSGSLGPAHPPGVPPTRPSPATILVPNVPGVWCPTGRQCPYCHMALVRRTKGEAVRSRTGWSPGCSSPPTGSSSPACGPTPPTPQPLAWEADQSAAGSNSPTPTQLELVVDVRAAGLAGVRPGLACEVEADAFPGQPLAGPRPRARPAGGPGHRHYPRSAGRRGLRGDELKPGLFVTARLRVPLAPLDDGRPAGVTAGEDRTAAETATAFLSAFAGPAARLEPLLATMAARTAGRATGRTLAIPAPAVIDTGDRKVVFIERIAGMFDGVKVTLGRRCGDHYPVLGGLAPGRPGCDVGAFLLDAERG